MPETNTSNVLTTGKDVSFSEKDSLVRQAFYAAFPDQNGAYVYCQAVYDNYLIVSGNTAEYWRVEWSMEGEGYVFTPRLDWQRVEQEWVTKAGLGVTVAFGGTVKALGSGKFRAPLVQFGDANTGDLTPYRDYFTKDTDFGIDEDEWGNTEFPIVANVLYHHGQDATIGKRVIGKARLSKDEVAVWMDGQLNMRDEYEQAVYSLIEAGKMGTSSGAVSHLVERVPAKGGAHQIKMWRGIREDASLTPVPADYRNLVVPIKALEGFSLPDLKSLLPQAQPQAAASSDAGSAAQNAGEAAQAPKGAAPIEFTNNGEHEVPEATPTFKNEDGTFNAEGAFLDMSTKFTQLMSFIENSPAIKSAGYNISQDGGAADPQVKSFGDFVASVRRGDMKRLTSVYNTKSQFEEGGAAGGILVPQEYRAELFQLRDQSGKIVPRVRRLPTMHESGKFPVLAQSGVTPDTNGQTAYAAGIVMAWTPENAEISDTDLDFEWLEWKIKKLSGRTTVSNELLADAGMIEAIIKQNFARALAAMEEAAVIRGNGVGMPLGFLNSPAKIDISPDSNGVFTFADATEMYTRFNPQDENSAVWIMHRTMIEQLIGFTVGGAGSGITLVDRIQNGLDARIWGYPIVFSEHAPKSTNSGSAMLVDLSVYLYFDRQQPAVAFSEHAAFNTDQGVFRVTERIDGAPWVSAPVTDANPQGSFTESPIVSFND